MQATTACFGAGLAAAFAGGLAATMVGGNVGMGLDSTTCSMCTG